ncbi:MAG: hypothetical protein AAGG48_16725 [Planctomycetota bacterium]
MGLPRDPLRLFRLIPKPKFTLLRLLGSITIVAGGCWLATLVEPGEAILIVVASVGSAIGTIIRGPVGSLLGVSITWLLLGPALIVFGLFAAIYAVMLTLWQI